MLRGTVTVVLLAFTSVVSSTVIHHGSSCGKDAIPYKIAIHKDGQPEMFCDTAPCIGKGSNPYNPDEEHAQCEGEFSETVCTQENEWTAGLIETQNGTKKTLRTLCCSYERLRNARELQTLLLNNGDSYEGGLVERRGRIVAFDVIKEIRKTSSSSKNVQYIVSVYRMSCLSAKQHRMDYGFTPYENPLDNRVEVQQTKKADQLGLFPEAGRLPQFGPAAFGADNYAANVPIVPPQAPQYSNAIAQNYEQSEVVQPQMSQIDQSTNQQIGPQGPPQQYQEVPQQQAYQPQQAPQYTPEAPVQQQYAPEPPVVQNGIQTYQVPPADVSGGGGYPQQQCGPSLTGSSCVPACASPPCTPSCGGGGCAAGGGMHLQCFSGEMEVETTSGTRKIKDLEKGDMVLSIEENMIQFAPVVMFLHKLHNQTATFYNFETESGRSIEMTADHLIYTTNCGHTEQFEVLHAKDVKEGQCFDVVGVDGKSITRETIVKIEKVRREGIYAPLTSTGDIFVNRILASCHSNVGLKSLQQSFFSLHKAGQSLYDSMFAMEENSIEHEIPFGVEYLHTVLDLFLPKSLY